MDGLFSQVGGTVVLLQVVEGQRALAHANRRRGRLREMPCMAQREQRTPVNHDVIRGQCGAGVLPLAGRHHDEFDAGDLAYFQVRQLRRVEADDQVQQLVDQPASECLTGMGLDLQQAVRQGLACRDQPVIQEYIPQVGYGPHCQGV